MRKKADVHVFLASGGQILPRWHEAFAGAVAREAGSALTDDPAGVLLLWVRLRPGEEPAARLAALPDGWRALPVVVLSDLPGDEEALAAFAAGARGYANTHAARRVLRRVAGVVLQGGLWIGESLMQRLVRASARVAVGAPPPTVPAEPAAVAADGGWAQALTAREHQVALRVAQGDSNKEVARALGITERTVKAHVGAILGKLQVRDRLQLSLVVNGRQAGRQPVPDGPTGGRL